MKKIIASLLLVGSLVACSSNEKAQEETSPVVASAPAVEAAAPVVASAPVVEASAPVVASAAK